MILLLMLNEFYNILGGTDDTQEYEQKWGLKIIWFVNLRRQK